MKIEIKKISILSLLTSAFPPVVFVILLLSSLSMLFTPSASPFFSVLAQAFFLAIVKTLIVLIGAVIGAFVYNFLVAVGMKGLKFDLEDVE